MTNAMSKFGCANGPGVHRLCLVLQAAIFCLPLAEVKAADRPAADGESAEVFTPSPEFQDWITALVREQLPDNYEKRKNWGHTARTFDGVAVWIEDGRLETRRKYKQANDGAWQLYRVQLKDPEEKFDVKISNIRKLDSRVIGLDVTVLASLQVFGRESLWEHGVQLYSVSAEADARVRLWASVEVTTRVDFTRLPPDIALDPEVVAAKFEIPDFRIRRIGGLKGPVIRSLSHATREAVEAKLEEDNAKLVGKLNRAINKQEKKLRLSLADLAASKWKGLLDAPASAP
jgi:hypothetical protein